MNWVGAIGVSLVCSGLVLVMVFVHTFEVDSQKKEHDSMLVGTAYIGNVLVCIGFIIAGYVLYLMGKG